jgi:uncharacterized protein (DUF362 family)
MAGQIVGLAKMGSHQVTNGEFYQPEALAFVIGEAIAAYFDSKSGTEGLLSLIQPGMTILIKPNWVLHYNQYNHGRGDLTCMYTQHNFVLAVLKAVLRAKPGRIIIGDAPVQGCSWFKLVTTAFLNKLKDVAWHCPIEVVDFRRSHVDDYDMVGGLHGNLRAEDQYLLYDLGKDSLLEEISQPVGRFRVTMYDPRKLAATHAPGRHQYLICREAIEADLVLNLPKLKTHRKAGITGALKNLVGINGNKDYLPHHRVGGTGWGGDCYPGLSPLRRLAEAFLDQANRRIGQTGYRFWKRLSKNMLNVQKLVGDTDIEGGWYGNDTVWRMILDINRILLYGRSDGTMAEAAQRQVWSLTDAIICGQGEGPLAPQPCVAGAVTFSDSSPAADWLHAQLLGFDPDKIPHVRYATGQYRWPLVSKPGPIEIHRPDPIRDEADTDGIPKIKSIPPRGWAGHIELKQQGVRW